MANRILAAAERYRELLEGKSEAELAAFQQTTDLTPGEGPIYQKWQSHAHASGILTLDEATTIYRALGGEAAEWDPAVSLALRLAVTQTMAELGKALLIPA